MNKSLILIVALLSVYLLPGCITEKTVKSKLNSPRPEWIDQVPDEDESYHYFVGRRALASTYEAGWDDAFQNAVSKISRMIQSRVIVDHEKQRHERDILHDTEIHDTSSYVRERVQLLSSEIARGVKEVASHYEELYLEDTVRYNVFILVRYPKDEYERIRNKISGVDPEVEKGLELLSQKQCRESIEHFSALTRRHPNSDRIQYYLALAYDECGHIHEALREYEAYVDMQSGSKVFVHKSKTRIRELKDIIAKKLIREAHVFADKHEYERSLDKLEQAYELHPSSITANKITEMYSAYSISSIAWDMSSSSDSLQDMTISVVPFTGLGGEESKQGIAVAMELKNELVNFQKLDVYERDDNSIKAMLKEIEFGLHGTIDENTRKELGKLVNTEAIVTGKVGYVANTFKINGWMINIETGKIITSRSVSVLGWNIDDTDKYADFSINVWMDSKVYNIGNTVTINLTSNRDCYVTLLNVRSNGEIWELFPNRHNQNNFVKANARYTIPSIKDNFRLSIVEPPGKEYIKAIATSVPITIDQIKQVLSEDTSILVASTDVINGRGDSTFRSVPSVEMRGLHEILMRGVAVLPLSENNSDTQFDYAVSTWLFETQR